jgi:hypothetical protein
MVVTGVSTRRQSYGSGLHRLCKHALEVRWQAEWEEGMTGKFLALPNIQN